jgi:bacterioferritin
MGDFVSDIEGIRKRARVHMEEGAVTESYNADTVQVIKILNEVLATELVCMLRYKRHYFMASGLNSESVRAEFQEHAAEEQDHADQIAQRITQLNGEPDFNPTVLAARSHAEYREGTSLVSMIEEDLVAERIAIESYAEIICWLGDRDISTRRLMERILEKEEEHADDLATFLERVR